MKVLQIHNNYKALGGEDVVVSREKSLLLDNNIEVVQYLTNNNKIDGKVEKIKAFINSPYSLKHKYHLKKFIKNHKPDVAHVHNIFPLLSPSVIDACYEMGVPVVMTIHNYRLLCLNALAYQGGSICEKCFTKKTPINGLVDKCYRGSVAATLSPFLINTLQNLKGSWKKKVSKFIFLTPFTLSKFEHSHLDLAKSQITLKSNFVEDRGYSLEKDDYYLFVGGLTEEKGVEIIVDAFKKNDKRIFIVGTGPLQNKIIASTNNYENIEILGFQDTNALEQLYKHAKALVFSSVVYEGALALVLIESFSYATPVIVPDLGNAGELPEDKLCKKYTSGDHMSLNEAIIHFEKSDTRKMSFACRKEYEENYSPEANFLKLSEIYTEAIQEKTDS